MKSLLPPSPLRKLCDWPETLLAMTAAIVLTEFGVMLLLEPHLPPGWPKAAADAAIMLGVCLPFLYRECRRRAESALLAEISQTLQAADDLSSALEPVLRRICSVTGWALGEAWLPAPGGTELRLAQSWVDSPGLRRFVSASLDYRFAPGQGLPGRVWASGSAAWVPDVTVDPDFPRARLAREAGLRGAAAVPVLVDGRGVLVLAFFSRKLRPDADEGFFRLVAAVVAQIGLLVQRKILEGERRRLAAAIEQSSEMVFITDAQGHIEYVNAAFTSGTGYALADVAGKGPRLLKSGRHDEGFYDRMWGELRAGRPWRGRIFNRKKAGDLFESEMRAFPVKGPDGAIVCYVTLLRDLATEAGLEEQLRQTQKMESLGLLAGGVAHDFNNILTTVLGYVRLLEWELAAGTPPDQAEFCRQIGKSALKGAELARQLLAFSGRRAGAAKPLDLNSLLSESAGMLRRIFRKDISIATDFAADLWPVHAVSGQLSQIVMNLAVNAQDAMPAGGTLTLATRNVPADPADPGTRTDSVCLSVADSGSGMDDAIRSRIFDPFFTTKQPGRGTGLGLSIVHGIISQAGGRIEVDTAPGRGSTFRILLPRASAPALPPAQPGSDLQSPGPRRPVLIVEDDADLRLLLDTALRRGGHAVHHSANGEEAVQVFLENMEEVAAVVLDLTLPDTAGESLARTLRNFKPGLRLVFVSGQLDHRPEALPPGAAFLSKPFTPEELLACVHGAPPGGTPAPRPSGPGG